MDDMGDNKSIVLVVLMLVLLLGGGIYGGVQCSARSQEAFEVCVKAGRAPAECHLATP